MHDLRHSYASTLINAGVSIYEVQKLLGHTNITTTQRYAHLASERLHETVKLVDAGYGLE
ncbi:phage integrase [Roseobacter sp. AzwK-3b]|nr:phage integrase [Roseobacter sp. AzwK-3b]